MTTQHLFTLSRADGEPVGDEYSHFVAHHGQDWTMATDEMSAYEPDDYDPEDREVEWVIEEWALVATTRRTIPMGPTHT